MRPPRATTGSRRAGPRARLAARLLLPMAFGLLAGLPSESPASLVWTEPSWSVTQTVSGEFPPYSSGSVSHSDPGGDGLLGAFSAYAENPPGPGGPSVTAMLRLSRSFRVVGANELVSLELPVSCLITLGPVVAATGANLSFGCAVEGTAIAIYQSLLPSHSFDQTFESSAWLEPGVYTVRGDISLNAFAFSGGPSVSADATVGVYLLPTPTGVPEPSGLALLAFGAAGVLGANRLRCRRGRRDRSSA